MTEMEKMQAEAVNSARAMYRRRTPMRLPEKESEPKKEEPRELPEQSEQPAPPAPDGGLFSALFEDKERTLIILLIILLGEEKTDPGVLLALMYCLI